jgi:transketolase
MAAVPSSVSPSAPVEVDQLSAMAARLRGHILDMCAGPEGGHLGGSLSLVEILAALYFRIMHVDPQRPANPERDILILSKGHSAIALYAALAERGFFPIEELSTFGRPGSRLMGHPCRDVPGVEMPTGSLGHGLALGAGFALAARLRASGRRTFVIVGDGELQEGSIWESALGAANLALHELVVIVDRNRLQQAGETDTVCSLEPLAEKWTSFGWSVEVVDGHDFVALLSALAARHSDPPRPRVIIANTVKGRGIPLATGRVDSHYVTLSPRSHARMRDSLHGRAETGAAPGTPGTRGRGAPATISAPATVATREAYRDALLDHMQANERVVCLDTDTGLFRNVDFGNAAERYRNIGIAEHNVMGIAAGLAASGWIPFVNTMAAFAATRALEAVKVDIAYNALPVRIAATHGGLAAGHFGPTHHALEDLAVMRALPNMTVVVPADAAQTRALVEQTLMVPGPVYLRLGRKAACNLSELSDLAGAPVLGRLQWLREGTDVVVIATGLYPVVAALRAAEMVATTGVSVAVLNAHTLKPFDSDTLRAVSEPARLVMTVEEHWPTGGLGAAVAESLSETTPRRILRATVPDAFVSVVGDHEHLLRACGIHGDVLAKRLIDALEG